MQLEMESNGTTMQWDLDACPGRHPRDWRNCPPEVLACHIGPLYEMPEHEAGYNRVLAALPFLKGTAVLRHVDLADIDETYRRGTHVVTLMINTGVFHDKTGLRHLFGVSVTDTQDATLYVAVFDNWDAAEAEFEAHIEP